MALGDDLMDELLREGPGPKAPGADGAAARAAALGVGRLGTESLVRMLDAAVIVVHAIVNLTSVAEEVLAEQRDRLRSQQASAAVDEPPARDAASSGRAEHIDLSY